MSKFVSYLRVSTARQGQSGLGLEAQQKAVTDYLAGQPGAELIGEFRDVESGKRNNRKGMLDAMDLCRAEGATLIIAKLDRLSRNAAFLLNLRDSGVDFVAADIPNANTLTIGVMALLAQQERELISKRTKDALAAKKARGEHVGGRGVNCFGDGTGDCGRKAVVANADARAEKLKALLLGFRAQGFTLRRMADELNGLGIPTARGGQWHAKTVLNYINRLDQE